MLNTSISWLPRGAMDLNGGVTQANVIASGWLPRGAMDLNSGSHGYQNGSYTLAPSWSHGSKFPSNFRVLIRCSWLPRGAMDLNANSAAKVNAGIELAPSWSHGSKLVVLDRPDVLTVVGSLVEPWI